MATVPHWAAYLTALSVVGVLVLLLRWAFGGPSRSLVERLPRSGGPQDYGLMVAVAVPPTYIEGELLRQRLTTAGLKASLVATDDGPRVMVFAEDEARARRLLAG